MPSAAQRALPKLEPDPEHLFSHIGRWRDERRSAGREIERLVVAYEAGRDGFWLARWLNARGVEAHVIHSSSVAVSRDRRRAKTDRLDAALLLRVLLEWLRAESGHRSMAAVHRNVIIQSSEFCFLPGSDLTAFASRSLNL